MIRKIVLENFLLFRHSTIDFSDGLNIVVGDNESGKSTLLETVNLALTNRWQGRSFPFELSQSFINADAVDAYLSDVAAKKGPEPPELIVELYLENTPATAHLKGTNNSLQEDAVGLRISAKLDSNFADDYAAFIAKPEEVKSIPIEFYSVEWRDFGDKIITNPRAIKVSASLIDASRIRLESGADYYFQKIIRDTLDVKERAQLSRAYRLLQEGFASDPAIEEINKFLNASHDRITDKRLTMEIDTSPSNHWEGALAPHLDKLPFQFSGSGERNKLKILLALARKLEEAHVILIEEPENHLSFSSLNQLIEKIEDKCRGRQVIVTTHSSYVVNKLGLERLMLLSEQKVTRLTDLPAETQNYFKKLSGYDTLRLVLAKAVILVEGPSDELILQRAYRDRTNRRPIEDGVDVINVRGLSAKRFLDLSMRLKRKSIVVADNDGDHVRKVDERYQAYSTDDVVTICRSEDDTLKTLEPQLARANSIECLNKVLGVSLTTKDAIIEHMTADKTEAALKFHDTTETFVLPPYIVDAIDAATK